jgi:hypothetical protein
MLVQRKTTPRLYGLLLLSAPAPKVHRFTFNAESRTTLWPASPARHGTSATPSNLQRVLCLAQTLNVPSTCRTLVTELYCAGSKYMFPTSEQTWMSLSM